MNFIQGTYRSLLIALILALLSACGVGKGFDTESLFVESSREFGRSLRWHDFQAASYHFKAEHRKGFLEHYDGFEDLRILDLEQKLDESEGSVTEVFTWLTLQYHILPSYAG